MYCYNCGHEINKEFKYCPYCGTKQSIKIRLSTKKEETKEKKKVVYKYDNKTKSIAVLSYLSILALIPYFNKKNNAFIKFHAKEGMNLLLVWIAYLILLRLSYFIKITKRIWFFDTAAVRIYTPMWVIIPMWILGILILIINIIGIVNVLRNKKEELPIVGKLNIIK